METTLYTSGQTIAAFPPIQPEPEAVELAFPEQPQLQVEPEVVTTPTESVVLPQPKAWANTLRSLGYGLILGSVILALYALSPILRQEINYRLQSKNQTEITPQSPYNAMFEIADSQKQKQIAEEAQEWGVGTDFSVVIPKISAASKIIPNVNPADESSYKDALMQGVGHASGSKLPGAGGTIYLFSHSTNSPANIAQYNAVFYLVKELVAGDEIIVFYTGRKFIYTVEQTLITEAEDTKWLTQDIPEERLILQTCWPPGTSTKRFLVIAKPKA